MVSGVQWPSVLIRRVKDLKIVNVARQKFRCHEQAYSTSMNRIVDAGDHVIEDHLGGVHEDFLQSKTGEQTIDIDNDAGIRVEKRDGQSNQRSELDRNMVQSAKSLREYRFRMPGNNFGEESELERSARLVNDDQIGGGGLYVDSICESEKFDRLTKLLNEAIVATEIGVTEKI